MNLLAEGVTQFRSFIRDAATLVVAFGGSLTGEHGDGQARAEFLPIMFGEELMEAMHEFKRIWDPQNRLNPGKVVHPYRVDENLRMGPEYKVVNIKTRLPSHCGIYPFQRNAQPLFGNHFLLDLKNSDGC